MPGRAFDLIAFDGDDTLWHNERSYRAGRALFRRLLTAAGVELSDDEVEAHVNRTEIANLAYYGYGVSSFVLSLIETAVDLTGGRVSGRQLRALIDLAKAMLTEEIELFASVRETVARLAAAYPLMLVTKGDLLHQRSKLERSGLESHFNFVEVVSHKTPAVYEAILARHGVEPGRFLMIGNSLRSDILPVVELGARAVHVPADLDWSHEHVEVTAATRAQYFELTTLSGLPALIEKLENETARHR
jgi:putative hydrolase of the HAD superfamily